MHFYTLKNKRPSYEIKKCVLDFVQSSNFENDYSSLLFLNSSELYICEINKTIVAYALFQRVLDEAELLYVFVLPDFRGQSCAQKLLDFALLDLKKNLTCNKVFLDVRPSNAVAIALYEKLGFEQTSLRKQYYKDKEDALLMTKNI